MSPPFRNAAALKMSPSSSTKPTTAEMPLVALAIDFSCAMLSRTNEGLRTRSSGGYPVSTSSGKQTMSAPAFLAFSIQSRTRRVLPARSPTVGLTCGALLDPRIGPGSILGGIGGAYLGGYIASHAIKKVGCACDAFAPAMALGNAVGRIGIFLAGVDGLGKPTDLPWGVQLPGTDYLVHPAPLYDAAFDVAWFAVLWALRDHPAMQNGNLLKFGVAGYAIVRFFIEFVRNNQVILLGLTGQQLFCLGLLVALA